MVASSNTQSSGEVVDHTPDGGLPMQRGPESGDAASERDPDDQVYIEPVDMLVPIG